MLIRFLKRLVPVVLVVMFCVAGAFVRSAPVDTSTSTAQSYIGTDRCIVCHRKQAASWSETKHAQAFEHLPVKYRGEASCLKCHVTGIGETGGYAPGMSAEEAQPFLSVGCEVCHGPGALHEDGVKRWTLADPADEERLLKEMNAAIRKTTPDSVCAECHITQAHQTHPPYDGQPLRSPQFVAPSGETSAAVVSLPPSPDSYSIKTCGSCHYEQYKHWRVGTHASLSSALNAEYSKNPDCLKCHRKSQEASEWYTPETDPQATVSQVGVSCESCHGNGFNHVLFNKQYIGSQRLGPELEQAARHSISNGKPVAACVQCHIRESHKDHAKYEATGVEK